MESVQLVYTDKGYYSCHFRSNAKMEILGHFLSSEVACGMSMLSHPTYQDWVKDDSLGFCVSGNMIELEKEDDYIFLQDMYSQENKPTQLKMSRGQLIRLLDEWQEKVCKLKPKEVIIKHENGEFSIETKD